MSKQYKFFVPISGDCWGKLPLYIGNEYGGNFLFDSGSFYSNSFLKDYNLDWVRKLEKINRVKEISSNGILSLFSTQEQKKEALFSLTHLGISLNQRPIYLTQGRINKIVNFLISERAVNGDCAYFAKGNQLSYLDKLENLGIVKRSCLENSMFYLSEDYKNKVENFKEKCEKDK